MVDHAQSRPRAVGPAAAVSRVRHWRVLAALATAQLMVGLDTTIINVALPSAQRSLGFSDGSRQWAVTLYALAFGSLLLLGGRLGDLAGRRRVLLVGVTGFAAASAAGVRHPTTPSCSQPARCKVPSRRCSRRPPWRCWRSPSTATRPGRGPTASSAPSSASAGSAASCSAAC